MLSSAQYTEPQESQWCLDSGATSHMCYDKKSFCELNSNKKCDVYTATEQTVESGGIGDVKVKVTLKDSKVNDIKLKDAMLVPQFRSNLLSVSRMTDNGYPVTFKKKNAFVNRQDGSTALIAKRQGQLYVVDEAEQSQILEASDVKDNNLLRWHQRFGHLNLRNLNKLNSQEW
ncbi:transposon ty5-1 protein [Lasius niger]|uniref:Transposon ty5-1 protein n=1 Tax=Lasius niger TaxID=67767 RepID=A0A0J7JYL3_LASNI|nr:transposon ty5-1 protein [Lasius niger]